MGRRVLTALGVVGIVAAMMVVGWLTSTGAEDASGCEGLSEYREAMMEAGEDSWDTLTEAGLDDTDELMTWTPSDWTTFADITTDYAAALQEIEPPAFAADWHNVKLDSAGLSINIGKAAADGGALMILAFSEEAETLDARNVEAYTAAVAACPDFADFFAEWDAIDGEIEGPPSATPAATPGI